MQKFSWGLLAMVGAVSLAGCGGGGGSTTIATPTPVVPAALSSFDSSNCFDQIIPGTGGKSLRTLIVPDTLRLDLSRPSGFPNGRRLEDPVIDILLSFLFLDFTVTGQSPMTLANLPLNPAGNDVPFDSRFPYMAQPQGNPVRAATTGTSFNFRSDPESAYVRIDRMGQPAITTTLISSAHKNDYNDADPTADAAGIYTDEQVHTLDKLHVAIGDDLLALGLKLCSRSK